MVVEGGEAASDAVWIKASDVAGGLDLDAGTGGITLDTTGALSLDSTGTASNLTLTANSGGNATLTIAASNTGAGVANLDIDADGAITVDGASFSVDATSASNLSVTGGQDFHRDFPAEVALAGAEHDAHAAPADFGEKFVAAYASAREGGADRGVRVLLGQAQAQQARGAAGIVRVQRPTALDAEAGFGGAAGGKGVQTQWVPVSREFPCHLLVTEFAGQVAR